MLVISQNITSTIRSSVSTRPYMAPAKASRLALNMPTPGLTFLPGLRSVVPAFADGPAKYQRQ